MHFKLFEGISEKKHFKVKALDVYHLQVLKVHLALKKIYCMWTKRISETCFRTIELKIHKLFDPQKHMFYID